MIKQIGNIGELACVNLRRDIYGRKIAAYLAAYGVDYPFCSAYLHTQGCTAAAILRFNNALTVSGDIENADELAPFTEMFSAEIIEMSDSIAGKMVIPAGMKPSPRIEFRMSGGTGGDFSALNCAPHLDRVYDVLAESFPELADFGMWLTDTSHRCRHGIGRTFLYKDLACASVLFEDDSAALVGEIATLPEARGRGLARQMLYLIADRLGREGKTASLFSLPHRASFYREIGFEAVSEHTVLLKEEQPVRDDISIVDEYTGDIR